MRRNARRAGFDYVAVCVNLKEPNILQYVLGMLRKLRDAGYIGKAWISFLDYDDDPRELWDIEECRLFVSEFLTHCINEELITVLGDDRRGDGPGIGLSKLLAIGGEAEITTTDRGYDIVLNTDASQLVDRYQGPLGEVN